MSAAVLNGPAALRRALPFRFTPGVTSLGGATFSRASVATYTGETTEPFFAFAAGGSLAAATVTRASTATYTAEV